MSREQWGHGYWKGVEDAQNHLAKELKNWSLEEIELIMEYCIAQMYCLRYCWDRKDDSKDESAFEVSRFYSIFHNRDKIDLCVLDVIYDYIKDFEPYNTQITGPDGKKNINEDVIRVYGALPEKFENYEAWNSNVIERMEPIFKKISNNWITRHGIDE